MEKKIYNITKKNIFNAKKEINNLIAFNENIVNMYFKHYEKIVCFDSIYKQNIKNIFNINKIKKIVLNTMHKNAIINKKYIIYNMATLLIFSMQKLKYTYAHKSIANFKLRKKMVIGCKVTLRNKKMYNFLEKLIYIILPKIKNFNTINILMLKKNNLTISLDILYNFPELENYFEYFLHLKNINISLVLKKKKKYNKNILHINIFNKEILLFLSGFQIPVNIII